MEHVDTTIIQNELSRYGLDPKLLQWDSKRQVYREMPLDSSAAGGYTFAGLHIAIRQGAGFVDPFNTGSNIVVEKTPEAVVGTEVSYKFQGGVPSNDIVGETIMKTVPIFSLSDLAMLEELRFTLPESDTSPHPDMFILKETPVTPKASK